MTPAEERALQWLRLRARIGADLESLGAVVREAAEYAETFRQEEPDVLALRGLGDVLHDFYTGLEKVFEAIAEEMEGGVPGGLQWHRALLDDMATELPGIRPPVLRKTTARSLDDYLRFRHLYRNIYGCELRWDRLRPLLEAMPEMADEVFADLRRFADILAEMAARLGADEPER